MAVLYEDRETQNRFFLESMKDFKFIGISTQGLRVYKCLLCEGRFTDSSLNNLKKWHLRWHKQLGK